jgi:predicted nucleotidyltransferase
MVILKLIAYDDRPEIRSDDIKDIASIIKHYFKLETENIYENHNDLFETNRKDETIASRVLGRQIRTIIKGTVELEKRITGILEKEIMAQDESKIAELMVAGTEDTVAEVIEILSELLAGIQET